MLGVDLFILFVFIIIDKNSVVKSSSRTDYAQETVGIIREIKYVIRRKERVVKGYRLNP